MSLDHRSLILSFSNKVLMPDQTRTLLSGLMTVRIRIWIRIISIFLTKREQGSPFVLFINQYISLNPFSSYYGNFGRLKKKVFIQCTVVLRIRRPQLRTFILIQMVRILVECRFLDPNRHFSPVFFLRSDFLNP